MVITSKAIFKPFTGIDITVSGTYRVGDYISGGAVNVVGSYIIAVDGKVTQLWYPSLAPTPTKMSFFNPSPTPKTSIIKSRKDAENELLNVLTAVTAAMADAVTYAVAQGGISENFGNTNHSTPMPFTGSDCSVSDGYAVGDYIAGGAVKVVGSYIIAVDGQVTQVWYPY